MRRVFGENVFDPQPRPTDHNWAELCTCGHTGKYHSTSTGGDYRLPESPTKLVSGRTVTITTAFHGCLGAAKTRNFTDLTATEIDREHDTMVERLNVTCPCEQFR